MDGKEGSSVIIGIRVQAHQCMWVVVSSQRMKPEAEWVFRRQLKYFNYLVV
jgi:hypothetical protein